MRDHEKVTDIFCYRSSALLRISSGLSLGPISTRLIIDAMQSVVLHVGPLSLYLVMYR